MSSRPDRRVARIREALRSEAAEPAAGLAIGDALRLVRRIGQGGMGSVWVADHLSLKTEVAVKFMRDPHADDAHALERFGREAAAAARIKSPHVVVIHDHGVAFGDTPYIVMELLEGQDLRRMLEERGALDLETTVAVVGQVAKALARAHGLGIVHRDVKPANVFSCVSGDETTFKLLDFGVAKLAVAELGSTSTGHTLGTPLYMSPEHIVSAKTVDFRADLWSLAVVAYECLTGVVPFGGDSAGAAAIRIERGVFAPPSSLAAGIPASLDAWFVRAFSREPGDRHADARELARSFAAAAAGDGAPSARSSSPPRRRVRRSAALRAAGVAGATLALGGGAWLALRDPGSPPAAATALSLLPQRALAVAVAPAEPPAPAASASSETAPQTTAVAPSPARPQDCVALREPLRPAATAPSPPVPATSEPTSAPATAVAPVTAPAPNRRDRGF